MTPEDIPGPAVDIHALFPWLAALAPAPEPVRPKPQPRPAEAAPALREAA
jgi:hypothetical protein